jgi:hypothetical protein
MTNGGYIHDNEVDCLKWQVIDFFYAWYRPQVEMG